MLNSLQKIWNTALFYGTLFAFPISPGNLAWKLFRNRKGKVPFVSRDLICDLKTLNSLPKRDNSLDEFTTAFSPFIPMLTLNAMPWKQRRGIFMQGLRKMNIEDLQFNVPEKKGDIYWDIYENFFHIGFKIIFGRQDTKEDFDAMYPGVYDINRIIKRQEGFQNKKARWRLYHHTLKLISVDNKNFIFSDSKEFQAASELEKVSIVVEDMLTSICIQCTDLVCHLILLSSKNREPFKNKLDNCINEALRLYPLTDIWTRKAYDGQRPWIASLVQLNRSGWEEPDHFKPDRWDTEGHPQLISLGFDSRSCPASKIGYNLSKKVFVDYFLKDDVQIRPASNYVHDRTFASGCQVWVTKNEKPTDWNYKGKWKSLSQQWLYTKLRVFDQKELW